MLTPNFPGPTTRPPPAAQHSAVVYNRDHYLSPSLRTFQAFDEPFVIAKGSMQYIWDDAGKKYIDLLGQNLCISVGHCHPKVTQAAIAQMKELAHCTTMYYHEQPSAVRCGVCLFGWLRSYSVVVVFCFYKKNTVARI
jgi:4-aminobutyrate aminotransferase-like enzyme